MNFGQFFATAMVCFSTGIVTGIVIEQTKGQPKDLWSLCQASPSVVWKSGPLEVRQDVRKHAYTCLMYLDGQGNKLPVILYKEGKEVQKRIPVEAIIHPQYDNAQLAASMASL